MKTLYLSVTAALLVLALIEWFAYGSNAEKKQDELLGQYVINMMYETSAKDKLSEVHKQILARTIVRVANDVFDTKEQKKAFVAVIAIESEFYRLAQSPTGPRGLSQVAKSALKEGLTRCGLDKFHDEDVWDSEINLYAGACYFRDLLETKGGDPFTAIVAYNQGPASKDTSDYAKSGRPKTQEALQYISRFSYLRKVPETKQPNIPAIGTVLPKNNSAESANAKTK